MNLDGSALVTTKIIAVSVITTCYGRNRHLYNLLSSLAQGSARPAEVIVVNDDADPEQLAQYPLNIVQIATTNNEQLEGRTGFDIGQNRNLGAAKATYDALVFLDVDCIVAPTFFEQLTDKLTSHPKALLMGQPRYLTRSITDEEALQLQQGGLSESTFNNLSVYNPYRFNFDDSMDNIQTPINIKQTEDYGAFWSLCFAISRAQFQQIGGFDTYYVGYGAEDTDFAFSARKLGIDFYVTADVIYHQQHSVYRPPLNHLTSIVINANRFYDKWQHWPMAGWLKEFREMGLIDWHAEQTTSIHTIRQPSTHEINDAHYPNAPFV